MGSLDFTAVPTVALNGSGVLANRSFPTTSGSNTAVTNLDTRWRKPFPIRKSSTAAMSSVTLSKSTVGAMGRAGANALSANKFSATFKTSETSQPLKFKLYKSSDTATNPAPIDTGSRTAAATSSGMLVQIGGVDVGRGWSKRENKFGGRCTGGRLAASWR